VSVKLLLRALTVLLVLCGAALALLVIRGGSKAPVPSPQVAGTAPAQALGHFIALDQKLPAPDLSFASFAARDGTTKRLADFRGKLVLVNLWATWCVPCIEEMPALDRLQEKLGSSLTILALSEDRRGAEVVDPFLAKIGIKHLAIYLDPKSTALNEFQVQGLPTSFLIGSDGMILGKLEGAAKWDEAPMVATLQRYIGKN
jgi:thiol-disulfide isomerase/thioredoxin